MALLPLSHRGAFRLGFVCLAVLLAAVPATAQDYARFRVKKVELGFRGEVAEGVIQPYIFKPGVWTPVHVTFEEANEGNIKLPLRPGPDAVAEGVLRLEVNDSDGIPNAYSVPLRLSAKDPFTIQTYARPGERYPEVNLSVVAFDRLDRPSSSNTYKQPAENFNGPVDLGHNVYLTLGASSRGLHAALLALHRDANDKDNRETGPRHAASETDASRLPTEWFGYSMADLVVLTTSNEKFVSTLNRSPERLKALAEWTRRGGRLLVSVSWQNQELVAQMLAKPAWDPPLPTLIAPGKHLNLDSLPAVQKWAGPLKDLREPFPVPRNGSVHVARLQAGKDAEVKIREEGGETLMLRVPYGRGSITLVALELDTAPFTTWKTGQVAFWKSVVTKLGPRQAVDQGREFMERRGFDDSSNDVTTRLERELDNFDVPVISFGWVALFILLYILVVGPLDYLILKKVFKRLEWTWITFPTVVLVVSVVAYFTAYALKGNDLRINKVDSVDIDLRSDLDEEMRPRRAYAYGTSWFAILSPRIQNYTIGLEPALASWAAPIPEPTGAGMMLTWLGRPESYGQNSFGRQRSQSLFRRTYEYAPDATGLEGVPIPVWTTKSFTASWALPFKQLPLQVDLSYQPKNVDGLLSGTIKSNLPMDLHDVYLFYGNKFYYPLEGTIPGTKSGAATVKVAPDPVRRVGLERWSRNLPGQDKFTQSQRSGSFNPTEIVKELLFHEKGGGGDRNHLFRGLDESWRLAELSPSDERVQDAILVARLPRAEGPADSLTTGQDPGMVTNLWLGELPGKDAKGNVKERPRLVGTLVQDTYIRVLLPVRPKQ